VVTVYYGTDVDEAHAEQIAQKIRDKYSDKQVEIVSGGQPHYRYIVSLE
jgi:dihydroxyacetone kinase-like predicted kinase